VIEVEAEDMTDDVLGDVDLFVDAADEEEEDELSNEERDRCIQAFPIPARPDVIPATETPPGLDDLLILLSVTEIGGIDVLPPLFELLLPLPPLLELVDRFRKWKGFLNSEPPGECAWYCGCEDGRCRGEF